MTDDRLPLAELMAKTADGDVLRSVAESTLQIIMEADVDRLIGAGRLVYKASAGVADIYTNLCTQSVNCPDTS